MAQGAISSAELQETAARLHKTLDQLAAYDSSMTLGVALTLLAVAAHNGPTTPEHMRLSQAELMAASRFRETKKAFSANLKKLSSFTVSLPTGKTTDLQLVTLTRPPEDYRETIPSLTPEGVKLIAALCRALRPTQTKD
jgi:DNA-binding MarR family transcriptional regulator